MYYVLWPNETFHTGKLSRTGVVVMGLLSCRKECYAITGSNLALGAEAI
jgi:hypothetical protein